MKKEAYFATAEELARGGLEAIPPQMISGKHLIYSSPATLAFNSPGAEGFGVKRAGLAVPDSIMLIVAPGCCGRNTSLISSMPEYNDRFFYLMMKYSLICLPSVNRDISPPTVPMLLSSYKLPVNWDTMVMTSNRSSSISPSSPVKVICTV